jgi:uncharacterized protein
MVRLFVFMLPLLPMKSHLIQKVEEFCTSLLSSSLNKSLHFHNLKHTQVVVAATITIGRHCELNAEEQETVSVAAWFHDTGYSTRYKGHKHESARHAKIFLSNQDIKAKRIEQVIDCIMATAIPQKPLTLLEKILCDADFEHLSIAGYEQNAALLRQEWLENLNTNYTDLEWENIIHRLMKAHTYWTPYGKTSLQIKKEQNMLMHKCSTV